MRLLSVLALGLGLFNLAQAAFNDVGPHHPHSKAIDYVEAEGMVSGYPDGSFRPEAAVNRAELTKILMGAIVDASILSSCPADELPFSPDEVGPNLWFAPYICQAYVDEIITGYPDNTFRPAQPVRFTESAKILANVYARHSVAETPVWYEGYAQALAELKAIPVELQRFDGELTRGQLAEMIYRLEARDLSRPSLTWEELETKTANAPTEPKVSTPLPPAEPQTGGPLPLPQDPEVSTPLPPAPEPEVNIAVPTEAVNDPYDFLPGVLSNEIKLLGDLQPRERGDYYFVEKGNVFLWWTQPGVFPARTILLVKGDTTPQHVRGLWQQLRGSTVKDLIVYSVPVGSDEAAVSAAKLPPILTEVVQQSYGGSFDFNAGVHAHGQLTLEGALKTNFQTLSLPTDNLFVTAGRALPALQWQTVASGTAEESKKKGTFKEAFEPTNYIEITHAGVWNRPLDMEGLELTDATVYYDDGNTFGWWGVGQFERENVAMYYSGPLVKSKDPRDYLEAQVGFGSATMSLPLYLKLMAAYQTRLPNSEALVFGELSEAKKTGFGAMRAGLDALPLEIVTIKHPPLANFQFKSGDRFPGIDKFNLVALGPLAQNKSGNQGPLIHLDGDAVLLGENFGDFDLTMDANKTEGKANGSLGLSLGSVSGQDLGTLGSSVGLEIYADDKTNRMKLRGSFSAGPLGGQGVAVDLRADNFNFNAPASCAFPFQLQAQAPVNPTQSLRLTDVGFRPQALTPDPAQLLSCPEDIFFVVKDGVTYAFNSTVKLAELANSYLPENEVTKIGIEGLKFAGGTVIEGPEEMVNLAKQVPGVGELTQLQNKLADEAKKAAQEAARKAAEEAQKAAEAVAREAEKAAREAAKQAERALNESVRVFNNFVSDPAGTLSSIGSAIGSVGSSIGGLFGGGGSLMPSMYWEAHSARNPALEATDIGVSHGNNSIWMVGTDGWPWGGYNANSHNLRHYESRKRSWNLPSDFPGAARIDADQRGGAVMVSKKGEIYTAGSAGKWHRANGYATDIGVGGGWVWMVSTEPHAQGWPGYNIYRARYRQSGQTQFNWQRVEGAAWRIDVGKDGRPWAINKHYEIWEWNNGWTNRHGKGVDVAVSADNRAWVIGLDYHAGYGGGHLYTYNRAQYNVPLVGTIPAHWQPRNGRGHSIGAGKERQVWVTNINNDVFQGWGP